MADPSEVMEQREANIVPLPVAEPTLSPAELIQLTAEAVVARMPKARERSFVRSVSVCTSSLLLAAGVIVGVARTPIGNALGDPIARHYREVIIKDGAKQFAREAIQAGAHYVQTPEGSKQINQAAQTQVDSSGQALADAFLQELEKKTGQKIVKDEKSLTRTIASWLLRRV